MVEGIRKSQTGQRCAVEAWNILADKPSFACMSDLFGAAEVLEKQLGKKNQ